MPPEMSPHSPGIIQSRIDLPEAVITFFQQRGLFIRSLVSYEQIAGRNPVIPVSVMGDWRFGTYEEDFYPIKNATVEGQQKADAHAKELLSKFTRNSPSQLTNIRRDYMISGMTLPIRITSLIDREINSTIYVKKPSVERIFGVLIYNLLSGHSQQEFVFNNYSFVERAITGEHLGEHNRKRIFQRPKFKESVVRLAELDDFISINDLERRSGANKMFPNFLISPDGELSAFDFNTILQPEVQERSPLVEVMRGEGLDISTKYEKQIRAEEARYLNARIYKNKHVFDGIIKVIDSIPYMAGRIKEKGYRSAKSFFRERAELLKKDMAHS